MRKRLQATCLVIIILGGIAQVLWFGSKLRRDVDFDGMTYTALAEDIKTGQIVESINAFRSPLISWLIALVPQLNVLDAGKLVTVLTFLFTAALLFEFAFRLWQSRSIAIVAALLFVLARGTPFFSVAFVTPDFLLAALVVSYFMTVLRHLRRGTVWWWRVGVLHGVAFLAKAIALPWLTLCSLVAIVASPAPRKVKLIRFSSAVLIPLVVAALWGFALYTKYGVFTTGSQFRTNLLQWTLHGLVPQPPSKYAVLRDISDRTSNYMAYDPMPPGSWEWKYHPNLRIVLSRMLVIEFENLPLIAKEMLVLLTPGIPIASLAMCFVLTKSRRWSPEWAIVITAMIGSLVLVLAYGMLAVDTRYFYPVLPLWFAIGAAFIASHATGFKRLLQIVCVALTVGGVIFSLTYWASPFRVQKRDWQTSCRSAGGTLLRHRARTAVSIGSGPYPQHGVGWEAGFISCYFSGHTRLIAAADSIPSSVNGVAHDVSEATPDAVLVWDPHSIQRSSVVKALAGDYAEAEQIADDDLGVVGVILFRRQYSPASVP